jgi:bifunctional DNA-binding transcriptional regulator/antitoxin component of YhaV-PrlF toxin-antitoxin module
MATYSRLTTQAQVSVPVAIRRALGIGPGSVVAWETEGDKVIVRRVGEHSSSDIHRALFGATAPDRRTDRALKAGIASHLKAKHARR